MTSPIAHQIEALRGALFTAWQFLKPPSNDRKDATLIGATTIYGYMRREDVVTYIRTVLDATALQPAIVGGEEVVTRLKMAAGYSCDPECEGRCKVCPKEAINEAIALLSALAGMRDEKERLREALRKRSIVIHARMTYGGGSVPSGGHCALCKAEWNTLDNKGNPVDGKEWHTPDCLLAGTVALSEDSAAESTGDR